MNLSKDICLGSASTNEALFFVVILLIHRDYLQQIKLISLTNVKVCSIDTNKKEKEMKTYLNSYLVPF